ncbi:MAG: ABC transporter permease [Acetobacteraceae bacterium]|nr:ABC transporter permease [Acetobacteraceae bacterium]
MIAAPAARAWPGPRRRLARASAAAGLIVPLSLLVLWQMGAHRGWITPQILPAPDAVWAAAADLWDSGDLQANIAVSLRRVAEGGAAGTLAGLLLGAAMGLSPAIEDYLKPTFLALAQVPSLALIPLLMMLLGIGEALKLVVIAKATLVPVALNTHRGIRAVPADYKEVGALFRFSRAQTLRRIVLPAAAPPIFTGLRYGLSHAWLALVAVELLASTEGLGYLLVWGRQMFQLDTVLVAMAAIAAIGLALDRSLAFGEARFARWRAPA